MSDHELREPTQFDPQALDNYPYPAPSEGIPMLDPSAPSAGIDKPVLLVGKPILLDDSQAGERVGVYAPRTYDAELDSVALILAVLDGLPPRTARRILSYVHTRFSDATVGEPVAVAPPLPGNPW